jgi:transcriptional regulator with XRE-family HTH domain
VAGPARLKLYMVQRGVSQTKLAKILRVGRVTLCRWLNEVQRPDRECRERISLATEGFVQPADWETPAEFTARKEKERDAAENPRKRRRQPRPKHYSFAQAIFDPRTGELR